MLEKYQDSSKFIRLSENIYKQLSDNSIRIALSCSLEDDEDSQYPLEDILDKYYVNCTDYFEEDEDARIISFELEGSLENETEDLANITEVSKLIGKRVYNVEEDGGINLVIE